MRPRRWALTLAITCALLAGGVVAASPTLAGVAPVELPGSHPAWARPANRAGGIAPATGVVFRVYLHTRDDAGLRELATAVSDPASAQYRRFLSAADVRGRFAPTDATVSSVRRWLRAAGLRVSSVPNNNMYVEAEGTAASVASAFGVRLGAYRVRGRVLRAADRNLSVPKAGLGRVGGRRGRRVGGVDVSQAHRRRPLAAQAGASFGGLPQRPTVLELLG